MHTKPTLNPMVILICLLQFFLFRPWALIAGSSLVGQAAPDFSISSGDDKRLTLNMTRGKVIVLFYETKEVVKKNKALKDTLTAFYMQQPEAIKDSVLRLVVINCADAVWPTTRIWKNRLHESSVRQDLTIYGDWNGKMLADYQLQDNDSNFMIIDKQGIIRYYSVGRVSPEKFSDIKQLLLQLVKVN